MTKLGSILMVVLSACTAAVDDPAGGGGGGDDTGEDGGEGAGNDTVRFRLTTFHDERGDQIDFTSGEPVHTHAGDAIMLGGSDCPDVYKYAYLMDAAAPAFGKETAPNPLAWKIEARGDAEYRVRGADDAIVADWAPVDASTITLHRDLITEGRYLLDVRVGEAMATTCWIHHPLAAPLEVQPVQADIAGMTFAANAPLSPLLGATGAPVFSQRFVHHTSEPVTLTIDLAQPTGAFMRRAVDDFVVSRTGASGVLCERDSDGFSSGDPLCTNTTPIADPPDSTTSGVLTTGTWSLAVVDEATTAPAANCTIADLRATCELAPRAKTAASQRYRIVASARALTELAPSTQGASAEHVIAGVRFTGRVLETVQRCSQFKATTKFGVTIVTCETFVEYTHIQALDQARIDFDAVAFAFAASPSAALPPSEIAAPALAPYTWDTGDADLPGPQ